MLLQILYTLIYVLPLYISPNSRPSPSLSRDAASVIQARIRAVTLSCILTSLITIYILTTQALLRPLQVLSLLGYSPLPLNSTFSPVLLTSLLFAGPLFERLVTIPSTSLSRRSLLQSIFTTLSSWTGYRNYVAGPLTEELLFRSHLIPLHIVAQLSPSRIVFVSPLYFGIAHVHHCYEYRLTHPHTPLLPVLVRTLVQFGYTTVFGWYATFVFLRTGSLWGVVLVHAFCNWCGLPRFWGRVQMDAGVPLERAAQLEGERDNKSAGLKAADGNLALGWSVAYYVILVSGTVAFYQNLWKLTDTGTALVAFGSQPESS